MSPLLYTSRFEVAIGALARYDEWFVQHASDLLGIGFLKVHGYRSSIAPRALSNVYELPGLDVFGDAYARAREADELGRTVRPFLTPAELGMFAPLGPAPDVAGAPGLGQLDLDAGAAAPEVVAWLASEAAATLADASRSITVFGSVAAPVAPAVDGRLRILVSCPTAEDAFRVSDEFARALGERFPTGMTVAVDVLTHRISYPIAATS
jgi:hypothetical protein